MSGSGGGGYGGGGGAGPRGASDCEIVERVPLNSVQPAVLPLLTVGKVLDVVVVNAGRSLVAEISPGKVAGALTPKALPDLLDCITHRERKYKATVLKVKGALVEVEIRPK